MVNLSRVVTAFVSRRSAPGRGGSRPCSVRQAGAEGGTTRLRRAVMHHLVMHWILLHPGRPSAARRGCAGESGAETTNFARPPPPGDQERAHEDRLLARVSTREQSASLDTTRSPGSRRL
ncbi:hypothetical protein QJS66_23745 (plasmid) [Kocuria rhizophila]|nr:hypothetical protein QJS66_23745 [Kocuria rhizophila]